MQRNANALSTTVLSRVTRFIEALDSFVDEDWAQLETDILTYYDTELNESRYLISDLDRLIDHWRKKGIFNLQKFKEYEVEFLTIVNWLLHKGKITQVEQHTSFGMDSMGTYER